MAKKEREEYYLLTDKLDEIDWALDGKCNDIDCDKYLYKDLLKKRFRPVLEHNYSCMPKLKREKDAILRILSDKKYKKYRFIKCLVCKKHLDKLNNKNKVISFIKPIKNEGKIYYQWKGFWVHKSCVSKAKIPKGWNKS
ncbi:MAG: hypothetical protein AABX85_03820 [Nanoarchaeota archaeon]